jgi:oxygen-independent coproporphyrinogen-3 oxidase
MVPSSEKLIEDYLDCLEREIDYVVSKLNKRLSLAQVHWGGGSPTYLNLTQTERLFDMIASRFRVLNDAEIAIEVDPRITTKESIVLLSELGFNRISMGVQDFSNDVQEAIGRKQTKEQTVDLFQLLKKMTFTGINMDFVYGLPRQTMESFKQTISELVSLKPDRLAIYNFAYRPSLRPNQKVIDQSTLPPVELRQSLFAYAVEYLTKAGYVQVGMDHFALPEDELAIALKSQTLHRNFMGYTTRPATDMVGFGMSSISDIAGRYAQNNSNINSYMNSIKDHSLATFKGQKLSSDDLIRRRLITFLMCNMVMPHELLKDEFDIEYSEYFANEDKSLDSFVSDGLVEKHSDHIEITKTGTTFIRNIAQVFDAYSAQAKTDKPRFSQSV